MNNPFRILQDPEAGSQRPTGWVILFMVMQMSGCLSLEEMAPPVDSTIIALAAESGISPETLVHGRQVYLTRCISCHGVEPVDRYSQDHWQAILPEMADEAKLDAQQQTDLLGYLLTAHQLMSAADKRAH